MPPSKFNQIGFCCLIHSDFAESQSAGARFLLGRCFSARSVRFPPRRQTTTHLHFVHNQYFYSMKGTPAAVFALTHQVKSCDTGSFLQATLHLQMSGSRVTHAGETLCCVTPSEELPPPRRSFLPKMLNYSNVTRLVYLCLC